MTELPSEWFYIFLSGIGSFASGFVGVRIAMARMEERNIALTQRVDRLEKRLDDIDKALYTWRHDEYAPQISAIWRVVNPLKAIMERIERFMDRPLP